MRCLEPHFAGKSQPYLKTPLKKSVCNYYAATLCSSLNPTPSDISTLQNKMTNGKHRIKRITHAEQLQNKL